MKEVYNRSRGYIDHLPKLVQDAHTKFDSDLQIKYFRLYKELLDSETLI